MCERVSVTQVKIAFAEKLLLLNCYPIWEPNKPIREMVNLDCHHLMDRS